MARAAYKRPSSAAEDAREVRLALAGLDGLRARVNTYTGGLSSEQGKDCARRVAASARAHIGTIRTIDPNSLPDWLNDFRSFGWDKP